MPNYPGARASLRRAAHLVPLDQALLDAKREAAQTLLRDASQLLQEYGFAIGTGTARSGEVWGYYYEVSSDRVRNGVIFGTDVHGDICIFTVHGLGAISRERVDGIAYDRTGRTFFGRQLEARDETGAPLFADPIETLMDAIVAALLRRATQK